ncbi:MAG: TetR family transcriptional regulator, partial [Xanthobacteraceae bacterium]
MTFHRKTDVPRRAPTRNATAEKLLVAASELMIARHSTDIS